MLIALSDTHQYIFANEANRSLHYSCPGCKKRVILKKGQVKIPHFAHLKKEECTSFSEGETEEHIKGKMDLYNWLEKLEMQVQLEPYLNELQQRPDILVHSNGEKIVIEFQCSPISIDTIQRRTEGYLSRGYKVIWIVGQKINVNGNFTAVQKAYIGEHKKTSIFLHYNFNLKKLYILSHIESSTKKVVYNKYSYGIYSPLSKLLMDSRKIVRKKIKPSQLESKMKQLSLMSYQKQNSAREFFSLMYQNRDTLHSIPLILFETVPSEWMIQTFSYQWKYEVLLWIEKQPAKRVLTQKIIKQAIDEWRMSEQIVFHILPNMNKETLYSSIFEFINHLTNNQVVIKVGENKWMFFKNAERSETAL